MSIVIKRSLWMSLALAFTLVSMSLTLWSPATYAATANLRASQNGSPGLGGCPLFPTNSIWNYNISNLPVARNSANYIQSIGLTGHLHAYFGATVPGYAPPGIPYVVVPGTQPYVPIRFSAYGNQSNPGPYPYPANAPIEGGPNSNNDRHVIVVDSSACKLYETWESYPQNDGSWLVGSGAVWSLKSNRLRPSYWTSADAAGLPLLPGLVRYDEVASGVINHALSFTVNRSQAAFLWPARHYASTSTDPNLPPMGLRLRLKASVDTSSYPPDIQVILTALKQYGMFVTDNGPSSWVLYGAPDPRWNNNDLALLDTIPGSDFETVDESSLQLYANSGAVK